MLVAVFEAHLLVGVVLMAPAAHAIPCESKLADTRPAAACVALFGNDQVVAANQKDRSEKLCGVQRRGKYGLRVQRKGAWLEPLEVRYPGVDLEATAVGKACEPMAIVQLAKDVLPEGCEVGRYAVGVDHAVGISRRIVAIAPGVVLLESSGTLVYMRTAAAVPPQWQVAGCGGKAKTPKRRR